MTLRLGHMRWLHTVTLSGALGNGVQGLCAPVHGCEVTFSMWVHAVATQRHPLVELEFGDMCTKNVRGLCAHV